MADPLRPPTRLPQGRLELTWTNKDLALLADDHPAGPGPGYQWVPRRDHRVAEVRLLNEVGEIGNGDSSNVVVRGDSLNALTALTELPGVSERYVSAARLVYIDPPFNTGQAFAHYDDALEHSVWLTMMRDRLALARRLLAEDGSIWVHLDDSEVAYCRVLLDELFGRESFVATIVWEKAQGARNDTDISSAHDYLLVYAKNRRVWRHARNLLTRTDGQIGRYKNPDNDPRGPWRQRDNATAKSGGPENRFPITLPSGRTITPPEGTYWRFSQTTFETARAEDRVYFGPDGDHLPRIKRYLSGVADGVVPRTWWPAVEVGSNQEAKRDHLRRMFPAIEPFATPKPERLLQRVISIATNPGDLVVDFFAGSGTTAAVALKTGRRFLAIEREADTVDTYLLPRLRKVCAGEDPNGITSAVDWRGGGGARVVNVAPSMYEEDEGRVVLADWATNGKLAQAVAAQLNFEHRPEPPFSGRRGAMRLAVLDGHADINAVAALIDALGPGERLSLCATSLDPAAGRALAERAPGSQARTVPADLVLAYRTPAAWAVASRPQRLAADADESPVEDEDAGA